jgi:hypothetical protein
MNTTIEQSTKLDQAAISRIAYELWEKAGRPAGKDQQFWFEAEQQMKAAQAVPAIPVKLPPAAVKDSSPARPTKLSRLSSNRRSGQLTR